MAADDARPPFLRPETWLRLDDREKRAVEKLVGDDQKRRRALEAARREIAGLRGALRDLADSARDEELVSDDDTPTPSGAPPRGGRSRRVSLESVDGERARIQLVTEVVLRADDKVWTGFSENLSAGGVFVAMWDPPPIGTAVRMDVELPEIGKVSARSVIRWHRTASNGRKTGCGVSFDPSEAEVVARLGALILRSWIPVGRTTVHLEDIP